jgi:iron complex outermembrane receptor protein
MRLNPQCVHRVRARISTKGVVLSLLLISIPSRTWAQQPNPDLSNLSLETLADTEITSVSRKPEKLSQTAAAAFVITQEDIRRSGLNSIPEVLRLVPGLDVAQIDANQWAITSRGFNETYPDKVLVMIDGRTVLDPLTSGVNWDVQGTVVEDIERIEVIRGPGASVWGANAVNGVINIITKTAKDTQGSLVSAEGGAQGRINGTVRYGGTIGDRGTYRIFGTYLKEGSSIDSLGHQAADDWNVLRGGLRSDWKLSAKDDFTVIADLYTANEGQTVPGLLSLTPAPGSAFVGTFNTRSNLSGEDVLARWHRVSSDRLDTTVQLYGDHVNRSEGNVLGEFLSTADAEFEQHFVAGRHNLVWGGDYRFASDRTVGSLNISFNPMVRDTNLFGAYLQDEFTLVPDRLRITLGSKVEHNSYSGFALQPTFRLLWTPESSNTAWLAVSRASENSSRTDADIRANTDAFVGSDGITRLVSSFGTARIPPENVAAYELGDRAQIKKWFSIDLATFFNHYTDRHTQEPAAPFFEDSFGSLHIVLPTITASNISGETHGLELSTTVKSSHLWKLTTGYTLFQIHLRASPGSQDFSTAPETEGGSPRQEFNAHLELDLPHKMEFDTLVFYVGKLSGLAVPNYTRLDARFGWRPNPFLEISAGLQNLLDPRHFEFSSGGLVNATQVGRNAYARVTVRF